MGSSYTSYQGKGFWARDAALEVWLYLLAREIESDADTPDWLRDAASAWKHQAAAGFDGCISAELDKHAVTPDKVRAILDRAERTLASLRQQGSTLSAATLNEWGLGGESSTFTDDVATDAFLLIGEAFIQLLKGQINWDAKTSPVL